VLRKSAKPAPFGYGMGLAVVGDFVIVAPVVLVFSVCNPPAILGGISEIVISPIYRQALSISISKRPCLKHREVVSPFLAHGNSTRTVNIISLVVLMFASTPDTSPDSVEFGFCAAVRRVDFDRSLARNTTTALR
jgi:hypothetical protein